MTKRQSTCKPSIHRDKCFGWMASHKRPSVGYLLGQPNPANLCLSRKAPPLLPYQATTPPRPAHLSTPLFYPSPPSVRSTIFLQATIYLFYTFRFRPYSSDSTKAHKVHPSVTPNWPARSRPTISSLHPFIPHTSPKNTPPVVVHLCVALWDLFDPSSPDRLEKCTSAKKMDFLAFVATFVPILTHTT